MKTLYVACVSGELEYKRWSVNSVEELIWVINNFKNSKYDKNLTVKKYNVENECDTCIDCLGEDILKLKKGD